MTLADVNAFNKALQGRGAYEAQYPNCNWLNADCNGDGLVNFADINPFIALLGGNAALAMTYVWDAENRLVEARATFPDPNAPTGPPQKATFTYDYLGRWVEKKVYNWVAGQWSATPAVHRKFVYQGWLMLMELDGMAEGGTGILPVRKYTWGLDLAGQMGGVGVPPANLEAAGGIGGLLAVSDVDDPNDPNDDLNYVYLYDANGNVGQLVDLAHDPNDPAGAIVAKYEYDPYGRVTSAAGPYGGENPFQYSTKYFDSETGLSYFGGRYYHPGLGRWLNRDPLEELGGANLYAYVGNDPVNRVDYLGWMALAGCPKDGNEAVPTRPEAPKPWGTCSDCEAVCKKHARPKSYGTTVCEGGQPCYCVCADRIQNRGLKRPGLDKANDAIEKCVADHEGVHVAATKCKGDTPEPDAPGQNEECRADTAVLECLDKTLSTCSEESLSKDERCRCLMRLLAHAEDYASCTKDVAEEPECPAKDVAECKKIRTEVRQKIIQQRKASGCRS